MGQLVTDYKFSVDNPYSSRVHLTSPKVSLPFFEENHGLGTDQDLNVDRDARGTRAPRY